jgi:acyl dehydratase
MRIYESVDALRTTVGEHLGHGQWHEVTQEQINLFADAIDDHQWIHVDLEAAKAGPFGTTIAHGYLTLSLLTKLAYGLAPLVEGVKMGINYGLNRVRFPAPVPVNSRIRAGLVVKSVDEVPGGVQIINEVTVEREGGDKPVCVAETVSRLYF